MSIVSKNGKFTEKRLQIFQFFFMELSMYWDRVVYLSIYASVTPLSGTGVS